MKVCICQIVIEKIVKLLLGLSGYQGDNRLGAMASEGKKNLIDLLKLSENALELLHELLKSIIIDFPNRIRISLTTTLYARTQRRINQTVQYPRTPPSHRSKTIGLGLSA